jgi:hypothetical protein
MTWGKASIALVPAILFDTLRVFFEWFVLFGPALGAVICTAVVGDKLQTWTLGLLGTKTAAAGCLALGGTLGIAAAPATIVFGAIMAIAIGFCGWLAIAIILLVSNRRIFKSNFFWFVGSLVISEIPVISSMPALSITVWRMYRRQIADDKAALAVWKKEHDAAQRQVQEQNVMLVLQDRAAQQVRQQAEEEQLVAEEQTAQQIEEDAQSAEAQFEEEQAANDDAFGAVRKAA